MIGKQARSWVPAFGLLALVALFLNLPEAPNVFGLLGCKTCSAGDPYLPLAGAGYFSLLIAAALLFPTFPGPALARGGLLWAVMLWAAMSWVKWPGYCLPCLVAHGCNILMWTIWLLVPTGAAELPRTTMRERLCMALFAPVAVVALFSTLNLTFMAYGFQVRNLSPTTLKEGEPVPTFAGQTSAGRSIASSDAAGNAGLVINFVSPACPFCNEQLPILNAVASQSGSGSYRFINVSPALPPELVQRSPSTEWVEDKDGKLREAFHVTGTPTLFVIGGDGKIARIIAGVPDEAQLRSSLAAP